MNNQSTSKRGADFGFAPRAIIIAMVCATLLATLLLSAIAPKAYANTTKSARPSVLLVDSSLGDFESFKLLWLGENATEVAQSGSVTLLTADAPLWWTGSTSVSDSGDVPRTFLLGSTDQANPSAISATDIAWALDQIAKSGAEPKTVVVASGATGLTARSYAEDLASVKQSKRADLVGLVLLGTPNNGYSALSTYPSLGMWNRLAERAGVNVADLQQGSAYLSQLNASKLPNIVSTLEVFGQAGDLGFGMTDGAAVESDLALNAQVSTKKTTQTSARATVSRALGLSIYWMPMSVSDGSVKNPVDANLAERLSAIDAYVTSSDVMAKTKEFYLSWFADGAPVTHISSVLALDISGSMLYKLDGETRMDAAKSAAVSYLRAINSRVNSGNFVPNDVSVIGFDLDISYIANGYDTAAQEGVMQTQTGGDTDIGLALRTSLQILSASPECAGKHVLLLSDGANTSGESNESILAGPVAEAASKGIVIDTVAFGGDLTETDKGFLGEIAQATGGTLYESDDAFGLERDFLRSYYSSLGLSLVDTSVQAGVTTTLGSVDDTATSVEVGVLTDNDSKPVIHLYHNGTEIDSSLITVESQDGLTTARVDGVEMGEYSVMVEQGSYSRAHLFGIGQFDRANRDNTMGVTQDYSMFIVAGLGVLLVVAIVAVVVVSRRKKGEPSQSK